MMKFLAFFLLLVVSQTLLARELVIISDLDETTKMANIESKAKAAIKLIEGVKPYPGLRLIFNEIRARNPETKIYYLSNSYPFLYDGVKWTRKHGYPEGTVYQRCLKDKSDEFKPKKLREIVAAHPGAKFVLFGDNIERDPKFYRELFAEGQIPDAEIFIRDARLIFPQEPNMTYFQNEAQITDDLDMSAGTIAAVNELPFNQLVPGYLLKNLRKRLVKACKDAVENCQDTADRRVLEVIDLIRPQSTGLAQN